jgi:hypothetical protein
MTRTLLVTVAALLVAGVVAVQLGGREAMGVVLGVLCGASVSMLGAAWQRHAFRTRPERSLRSVAEMFLFKLAFLLLGALSLRYVEAAAERADWRAFLVAFVAVSALVHTTSVVDNVRLLKAGGAGRRAPAEPSLASTQAE